MALSAATIWEVRPSVGTDTNGGGFVTGASGTDYSQQNSKNTTGSDISTTDGVGNGTTTWTSATGNFSTAIVGNIIFLSGTGITTGWYQVTARASTTSITLDRSPGTGTGATMNIGGALATISQAITNNSVAGMIIYCQASGTYTTTTVQTTGTLPVILIGYTTTRTDNGRVTWTTATSSIDLIDPSGGYIQILNFNFTTTASTKAQCIGPKISPSNIVSLTNCIINGFNIGVDGNANGASPYWSLVTLILDRTEIKNCIDRGVWITGTVFAIGSTVHDNGNHGIQFTNASNIPLQMIGVFSAFKNNGGKGVYIDFSENHDIMLLVNCDCVGNTSDGAAVNEGAAYVSAIVWNCIFYLNGGFGFNFVDQAPSIFSFLANAFGANTSGNYHLFTRSVGDIALTADPFTNRTGTPPDLSLNATAGGGAACTGAASPSTLPFTT